MQAAAAGAGVDPLAVAFVHRRGTQCGLCGVDVAPCAATGVGQAMRQQILQCVGVARVPPGLPYRLVVGHQAQGVQLGQDEAIRIGLAAQRVDVLDANQPLPAVRSGVQPCLLYTSPSPRDS